MLLTTPCSSDRVAKAKREVRPSRAAAKQGLGPRATAASPLLSPPTGKGVGSKRGDLKQFQLLDLRARSLSADADHVSQAASIRSEDFHPHTLLNWIHSQALSSLAPSPSGLQKPQTHHLGA